MGSAGSESQSTTDALDGRAPSRGELRPAVEATFERESYAPGSTATLEISDRARGLTLQVFRIGSGSRVARGNAGVTGIPTTGPRRLGPSSGFMRARIAIGNWPSGLYFARLVSDGGRLGFAPFVVRPRRLGQQRVAVVLPTLTWQAYNLRDMDGDEIGDSWYANWARKTVRLDRPHLNRGVPWGLRRDAIPILRWLDDTARVADILSQSDIEKARSAARLNAAYDLLVFPGHHEYVTEREYDLVEGFRDRGGSLAFLSSNNFFWRVERRGTRITRIGKWRDLGRPEARLIGVQYRANGRSARRPWVVQSTRASSWILRGAHLRPGSEFGRGGFEIDGVSPASPRNVQVVAEIADLFGSGTSGQMTYYDTPAGAQVFAAGAFDLLRRMERGDPVWHLLENLWERLTHRSRAPSRVTT